MAELVLAIGTSLSPLLSVQPEDWVEYLKGDLKREYFKPDGSVINHEQLKAENGDKFAKDTTPEEFQRRFAAGQVYLNRLSAELAEARPDVVVIVGDDHGELFNSTNFPAVAVYAGATLANQGTDRRTMQYLDPQTDAGPKWRRDIQDVQAIDAARNYPGAPDFALSLAAGMTEHEVDIAMAAEPPPESKAGMGFCWGFVINRLFAGRDYPVAPVLLNTWYPPNVPTPARCYKIGQALAAAIKDSPLRLRVAVVVAGGLSHIGINEDLDRTLVEAVRVHDAETLANLPREALVSGTSQLLNWVVLGGIADQLDNRWAEYLPVYRTSAGTGIGLAFGSWS